MYYYTIRPQITPVLRKPAQHCLTGSHQRFLQRNISKVQEQWDATEMRMRKVGFEIWISIEVRVLNLRTKCSQVQQTTYLYTLYHIERAHLRLKHKNSLAESSQWRSRTRLNADSPLQFKLVGTIRDARQHRIPQVCQWVSWASQEGVYVQRRGT